MSDLPTLADSLGGGIGNNLYTFSMCRVLVDESMVAEGGAAVGYAALLSGKLVPSGPTAVVVAGRPVQVGDIVVRGQ